MRTKIRRLKPREMAEAMLEWRTVGFNHQVAINKTVKMVEKLTTQSPYWAEVRGILKKMKEQCDGQMGSVAVVDDGTN